MSSFWSNTKIKKILGMTVGAVDTPITGITTDSRTVKPGSLFVAIQGDVFDGHDFIFQAIQKGAVAILAEERHREKLSTTTAAAEMIFVPSTLDAIRTLAHAYRKTFSIPLIAVVGAVGKTTTKELIASLLLGRFQRILKTKGSENGFLGIPLTLLNLTSETEIGVVEIGIDEIDAMEKHLALVEPTHFILTATGPEHLHQLKTVEIAATEELKAFDYALKHGLPMAISLSDRYVEPWFKKNKSKLKSGSLTYSLDPSKKADLQGVFDQKSCMLKIESREDGTSWTDDFTSPLPGTHHAHNLLAAISLVQFFKLSPVEMKNGLSHFKTAYGRTEIHELKSSGVKIIGDYYNSNPTSCEAAFQLLADSHGRMHAVLGDMLELGEDEEKFHRGLAPLIFHHQIQRIWLYGRRMKWLEDELIRKSYPRSSLNHFETHEALTEALKKEIQSGDVILLKGSRGMKMEKILEILRVE